MAERGQPDQQAIYVGASDEVIEDVGLSFKFQL